MEEGKRRAGRPTKPGPKDGKATLGIRATSKLKDQLLWAARSNHRSLSQEAELRLEQSFQTSGLLEEALSLAYGRLLAGILVHVGDAMLAHGWVWLINNRRDPEKRHWLDDPDGYRLATLAALRVFEAAAPTGDRRFDDAALREKLMVQILSLSHVGLGGWTQIANIVDTAKMMGERQAAMLERLQPLPGSASEVKK